MTGKPNAVRVFKTAWFTKVARKAGLKDDVPCDAIASVMLGQMDDLGGGVFKKRLNQNRHRAIILAKVGQHWIFEYLFAKQDRANIEDDELRAFRKLAAAYAALTGQHLEDLVRNADLTEICHDRHTAI